MGAGDRNPAEAALPVGGRQTPLRAIPGVMGSFEIGYLTFPSVGHRKEQRGLKTQILLPIPALRSYKRFVEDLDACQRRMKKGGPVAAPPPRP